MFSQLLFPSPDLKKSEETSQSLNKEIEERSETIQTGNGNYPVRLKILDLLVRKPETGDGFERRNDAKEHTWNGSLKH